MFIKSVLFSSIVFFTGLQISAQVDQKPHVYALVVGISAYQDPFFSGLKYADDDAVMFANFLWSHLSKPADSNNIVLLTDSSATAWAVYAAAETIRKTAKKGDTVYFFFSGHGDAYDSEHIFLMCHEAVKGNYQGGGTVRMSEIKDIIKELNFKGVKVTLITDACRSNEDNENTNFIFSEEIMRRNSGEIQFTSCSKNQNSFEDERWGYGHGVFSWYLVKGWMGMADADTNKRVTFDELSAYVISQVSAALTDKENDGSVQTPQAYSPKPMLMARVNPKVRNKLINKELMGENDLDGVLISRYIPKGIRYVEIEDDVAERYYKKLKDAIWKEQFIGHDSNNAVYYYEKFRERMKPGSILNDVRLDLMSAMANKAQSYIQEYMRGNDTITLTQFRNASLMMYSSLALADSTYELYRSMKARALFLEANSMVNSESDQTEMIRAFRKLDSSLRLEPDKAYIYYNKARIYERFDVYFKEAEENYLKAIELAPRWVYPIIDLGAMYVNNKQYDKGSAYFNKAIKIAPGAYIYTLLGYTYHHMSDKPEHGDSAIMYYQKALEINKSHLDARLGIAAVYVSRSMFDTAFAHYSRILESDPTYYYTYMHIGGMFYRQRKMEEAVKYYKTALEYYPGYTHGHYILGYINQYYLFDYSTAIDEYEACIKLSPNHTRAYVEIGNILIERERYDLAIEYMKYPHSYDPRYYNTVEIAKAYLARALNDSNQNDYDSARLWLDTSNYYFPNDFYTYTLYGNYYSRIGNQAKAMEYYLASAGLNEKYYYNFLMLGYYYHKKNSFDSAIYFYKKGIEGSPYTEDNYEYLWKTYYSGTKDYRNAALIADKAIAQNLNEHYFYSLKAYALLEDKQYEPALVAIDSAIVRYPFYGRYYYVKAMILSSLNQADKALESLERATELGLYQDKETFYDGSFKNIEKKRKFKRIVKKYLRDKNKILKKYN